jgi:hypothetical protein
MHTKCGTQDPERSKLPKMSCVPVGILLALLERRPAAYGRRSVPMTDSKKNPRDESQPKSLKLTVRRLHRGIQTGIKAGDDPSPTPSNTPDCQSVQSSVGDPRSIY